MAKKVKLNLTVSGNELWWSSDGGVNWAVVGPKSPVTVLQKGDEIEWLCDNKTITDIDIIIDSGDAVEKPTGSNKDKTCKVNPKCKDKDVTKYTISVNGGSLKLDPEIKICDPTKETCDPT